MKTSAIYTKKQKVWGAIMFLTLLWLTVSLPFVYNAQQLIAKQSLVTTPLYDCPVEGAEDCSNPLANSVEEKVPCNSSILEEYVHHHSDEFGINDQKLSHIDNHSSDLYVTFHGELLSPPPESLLS